MICEMVLCGRKNKTEAILLSELSMDAHEGTFCVWYWQIFENFNKVKKRDSEKKRKTAERKGQIGVVSWPLLHVAMVAYNGFIKFHWEMKIEKN